jgi:antitoxin component of MazEF toxin-antitoxin module
VHTKIQKIGEGFGLLLPKDLLEACGFGSEAVVTVQNNCLIVTPGPHQPRLGWAEALSAIPDEVLRQDGLQLEAFRESPESWDATEWQWPAEKRDEKI